MAERRMFSKTIIDSDAFLDMPLSTQAMYFHLSMRADDEGFINNPRKIQRMIGCSEDDMKILIAKRFVLTFESGVLVIKHWKIHNYIRADRMKKTIHQEELSSLSKKENGSYTDRPPLIEVGEASDGHTSDTCQPNVGIGKDRLGKDSIDKDSIDKDREGEDKDVTPPSPSFEEFNIFNFMQETFNRMFNSIELETLQFWLNDYDVELIKEATKIAVLNNAYSLKYIEGILRNWEKKNLTTVVMVREQEAKRNNQKQSNKLEADNSGVHF